MFVTSKTHNLTKALLELERDAMGARARIAEAKYNSLLREWNALVGKINAHGGESLFHKGRAPFNIEDLNRLIMLCHPDKHDGKPMAVSMTQKLLAMR